MMDAIKTDCIAGRRAAREAFNAECEPNWSLVKQRPRWFVSGFVDEYNYLTWRQALAPGRDCYGGRRRVDVDTGVAVY